MFYAVSNVRRKQVSRSERLSTTLRLTRNLVISASLITGILIVGGVMYTLIIGYKSTAPQPLVAATSPPLSLQPTPTSMNSPVGVAVQAITTPVKRGNAASLSIATNDHASCSLSVTYPGATKSQPLLKPVIADVYGVVVWNWRVDPMGSVGAWQLTVTCIRGNHSGVVAATLDVQ